VGIVGISIRIFAAVHKQM